MWDFLNNIAYSDKSLILILAAFLWGIASIVLSPCHLTSIPLAVTLLSKQNIGTKPVILTTVFALAVLISIVILGFVTGLLGMMLGNLGITGEVILILCLIYFGLASFDVLPIPGASGVSKTKKGIPGAFITGLIFGTALGPCTFAFIAPILGIIISSFAEKPVFSVSVVLSFSIGHSILIVLTGYFWDKFKFSGSSGKIGSYVRKIAGSILIIYALYKAIGLFLNV